MIFDLDGTLIDSPTDVAAAHNAALPVIAVSWGYSKVPAAKLGADILIDRFADLPGALARLGANAGGA